jgi:hypothetical protein
MNSNTGLALSVIGITAVLMLALAPITANHQTFAYRYYYGKHYYGHGHYYGYGPRGGHFYHGPHGSFYHGPHGGYAYRYHR